MRALTRTRAYWGPFLIGVVACLVVKGLAQTPIATGGWGDYILVLLVAAIFGAVSLIAGGPARAAWGGARATWGGALAGLAGFVGGWVLINVGMGNVVPDQTADFENWLGYVVLVFGVPYLVGYGLAWYVERSRSSRGVTTSRA